MTGIERSLVERPPDSHSSPPLHPPPFDKLPTEVVQDIFSLACPDAILHPEGAIVPFHIKLGLVCAKWHSIVAAHHSLWATFEIDAEGAWNPKFGVYLRKYLRQSGTHPLMILVVGRGREEVLSEVLDIIIPHCERWHSIKLDFPLEYRFLQKLVAVRDRLPLLRRLRIAGSLKSYPLGTQDFAIFRNAPLLDRITVDHVDKTANRMLALPWNQVSRANVDGFSFGEIQSSLELSQTLTALTLSAGHFDISSDFTTFLRRPATLEKLRVLHVRDDVGIGHLTCPSLKGLKVIQEGPAAIHKLLDKSSCALTHLELRDFRDGSVAPIIQHTSLAGLTFLHLEEDWITNGAMDILVLDSRRLLPVLQTLYVGVELDSNSRHGNTNFKSQIQSIRAILESRTYHRHGISGTLSYLNDTTQDNVVTPLKECHFAFSQYQGGWEKWPEERLQCLRSFSNSRNVLVVLTGFGVGQDFNPCDTIECYHTDDSDESDNTYDSSDNDDSDNSDNSDDEL